MEPESANVSAGPEVDDSIAGLQRGLESTVETLKTDAKDRTAMARELAKISKPGVLYNLKKLETTYNKLKGNLEIDVVHRCGVEPMLRSLAAYVHAAPDRLRREVGIGMKKACAEQGLEFRVVSKEEPIEVRIPPLSIVLDFKKSKAVLQYARDAVDQCNLHAEDIMKAYEKAVEALNRGFDPDDFFEKCRQAYLRVVRLDGLNPGDRVEILRFLPELAFLMQPKKFQENPIAKNYRPYSRARFAYDIHRLRQAGGLVRDGLRINLGVATGTTATKKRRVIYMEDPFGAGEYKLTVFFTKS